MLKLIIQQYKRVSVFLFLAVTFCFHLSHADLTDGYQARIDTCITEATTSKTNAVTGEDSQVTNSAKLRNCVSKVLKDVRKKRDSSSCDSKCKEELDDFSSDALSNTEMPESRSDTNRTAMCDAMYDSESEDIKECKKLDMKTANACAKAQEDEGLEFLEGDTMQMASPLLSSVSGADALLGMYGAMKDRPGCYLNKTDFKDEKDSLTEQKKELDEKVKENMEAAEEAQKEYSEKLKEWAEREGAILDEVKEMPAKKEDARSKLEDEKIKTKMQADSQYGKTLDDMGELRRKYNDMVSAKAVAMSENSEFMIHDRCALIATGGDPAKQQSGSKQAPSAVQSSFAGAFAQGKVISGNIQKRYDSCVKTEALKLKRIEGTFVNELAAIKAKLTSLDTALGQINDSKRLAEESINKEMQRLERDTANQANKLAAEYQRIQADKKNEQTLLKQKLERIATDTKKQQQELAILSMKLSAYSGKRPPKTGNNDKSMAEMMDQCGANFISMISAFKRQCCNGKYNGVGVSVCKMSYKDFEAELPKLTPAEKKAAREKRSKDTKEAAEIK